MGWVKKVVGEVLHPNQPECGATVGGRRCTNKRKPDMLGCCVEHANFNAQFKHGWL